MRISRRSAVAIGVLVLLSGVAAVGRWYEKQSPAANQSVGSTMVNVTNGGDRGPGTLREALFIAAAATGGATVAIKVPQITVRTALPPLVNPHGVSLVAHAPGTLIDAHALAAGPVFDIAGPNPTTEEQKYIDQQYTVFLDKQRRSYIAAALTAKQDQQEQQDQQQQQQASLRNEKASMPMPPETPVKPKVAAADLKARAKAKCAKHSTFSCEWPVLSEKITNLKKALFGSTIQAKTKRGGLSSRGEASERVQSAAR